MSEELKDKGFEVPTINEVIVIDGPGNGNPDSSISLQKRLANGEVQLADIDEAVTAIGRGEFLVPVRANIIETCGDGRSPEEQDAARAQMFGGTFAFVKDVQLAGLSLFGAAKDKILARMKQFSTWRKSKGLGAGNHEDDHSANSGCGEQDGAPASYGLIVNRGDEVKAVVNAVRSAIDKSEVTDQEFDGIATNASAALEDELLPHGADVRDLMKQEFGNDSVETLQDKHNELIYIINLIPGYTFDREKFRKTYGNKGIDAFNEDQPIIEEELRRISESDFDALDKANWTRRIATAMNLTKNDLKIVIIR